MAGGASVFALAKPAGGVANRHAAGGDRRGGGRDNTGYRSFDEYGFPPGNSRQAAKRYRAREPEAHRYGRDSKLSAIECTPGRYARCAVDRAGNLRNSAAIVRATRARDCAERSGPGTRAAG